MSLYIESVQNKLIKEMNALKLRKRRSEKKVFVAEGLNFVSEIPHDFTVEKYIFSKSFAEGSPVSAYEDKAPVFILSDELLSRICDTENPQGIMAVVREREYSPAELMESGDFFVICEEVKDPGNVGTIIRTADACGVSAVFLTKGSADLFSGKTLRSTMGSIFHVPAVQGMDAEETAQELKARGVQILGAHPDGRATPYELDLNKKTAFIIGNETKGISETAASAADFLVKLPMPGRAESLNAAVAAAVLMYETLRQRMML